MPGNNDICKSAPFVWCNNVEGCDSCPYDYDKEDTNTTDEVYELCPHCENEVKLVGAKKKVYQECPICKKKILPCSLCEQEEMNCGECQKEK